LRSVFRISRKKVERRERPRLNAKLKTIANSVPLPLCLRYTSILSSVHPIFLKNISRGGNSSTDYTENSIRNVFCNFCCLLR
jgi:hypothetical protein